MKNLKQNTENDFINLHQVSELTGYSINTIYKYVQEGKIKALKRRKPLIFSLKEMIKFLKRK